MFKSNGSVFNQLCLRANILALPALSEPVDSRNSVLQRFVAAISVNALTRSESLKNQA